MYELERMNKEAAREQRIGELMIGGAFAVVGIVAVGIVAARVLWMWGAI